MLNVKKYYLATLLVVWCLFNIFMWQSLLSLLAESTLSLPLRIVMGWGLAVFFLAPFISGTLYFDALGKSLTVDNDLFITFARISPLIFVYFMIIFLIWYPGDGRFTAALSHTVSNPNWLKIGFYTLFVYCVVSVTAKRPYKSVTSGLLGTMAVQHIIALASQDKLDGGCATENGYVDCGDNYLQYLHLMKEKPSSETFTYESLIASELSSMLIYSIVAYVVISVTKEKLYP
jgi:hypothetical protein